MATTKAQQKAVHKYVRNNYDRIGLTVPRGRGAEIEATAAARGLSVNAYVCSLIRADMGLSGTEWKQRDTTEE